MRTVLNFSAVCFLAGTVLAADESLLVRFVHARDIALPAGVSWSDAGAWEFCEWPQNAPSPAAQDVAALPLSLTEPFILDINPSSRYLNWYHAYALEHKHIPPTAVFSKLATSFSILVGKKGDILRVSLTPRLVYDTGSHEGEIAVGEAATEIPLSPGGVFARPKHPLPKRMLRALAGGADGGALFLKRVPAAKE